MGHAHFNQNRCGQFGPLHCRTASNPPVLELQYTSFCQTLVKACSYFEETIARNHSKHMDLNIEAVYKKKRAGQEWCNGKFNHPWIKENGSQVRLHSRAKQST